MHNKHLPEVPKILKENNNSVISVNVYKRIITKTKPERMALVKYNSLSIPIMYNC